MLLDKSRRWRWALEYPSVVGVAGLLLLWQAAATYAWLGHTLIASPREVLAVVARGFQSGKPDGENLYPHLLATLVRAFRGWFYGVLLGIGTGLLAGRLRFSYAASEPVLEFFRAIPPILAFPLFLVAFDFGESAYVWTIVFGSLPVMILTVARGAQSISRDRLEILDVFRVGLPLKTFATAMEVAPSVFLGMRITFSLSLVIAVVSEMVFSPRSGRALGALARDAEISFDTPTFYACALLIGVYGFVMNAAFRSVERRVGLSD